MDIDTLFQFWAKKQNISGSGAIRYPLLFHMVDTVAVAREMWDSCLHAGCRMFCADQIGTDEGLAAKLIPFWAGLHDIGKASPGFQCKDDETKQWLKKIGLDTDGTEDHGTVTAHLLNKYLSDTYGGGLARQIATAVGGHHGIFPRSEDIRRAQAGRRGWNEVQRQIYDLFMGACDVGTVYPRGTNLASAFLMFLAGLTSVADWIASNETFFPIDQAFHASLQEHKAYARGQALKALKELVWTEWQPPSIPADFKQLFKFTTERPLQTEAVSLASVVRNKPGLVIIEAPMGEGKTEAAMYLTASWNAGLGQKGCYFALPTMATSDQMFGRVKRFLENHYRDQTLNLVLLHGHAALSAEFESQLKRFSVHGISGSGGYDGATAGVVASEWFTYRKRGLLAPFGVGTIDQVLLAALQTRHVFVRLFGLADKTIIIDEVHAYDVYMTTLLGRLLEWLAALRTSVVMLSATLPKERKNALLKAYAKGLGKTDADIPAEVVQTPYPRISWIEGEKPGARTIDTSPHSIKKLRIRWVNGALPKYGDEFELGRRLKESLSNGGCAAVICNTVDWAQEMYSALRQYLSETADDGQPVLDLLHARYLFGDRKTRQERSEVRFGKPGATVHCQDGSERPVRRPNKAVLVATQVIEQSLDLDFDLMVTDMAPIDLLLQRAGRLHRHERTLKERHGLAEPVLWICQPYTSGGVPDFGGGTKAVYDYHVLLRTWLAIKDRDTIEIPGEVETLIEAVYDERGCPEDLSQELKQRWGESRRKHDEDIEYERNQAEDRWIKWPGYSGELWRMTYETREEDDPSLHQAHRALTRLAGLTVNVICLYGTPSGAFLDKSHSEPVSMNLCPDMETVKRLLRNSISVSRQDLAGKILDDDKYKIPVAWRESALLRHHYVIFFDENKACGIDTFEIRLDDELGMTIKKGR